MKIDDAFQTYFTSTTATYILELHAGNIPPLVTLGDQIQAWRDVSAAHNVTFFAFTIIRNPLAQTISHFNDHCLVRQRSECQLAKDASLVDSFILSKEHVPNFQTHYYLLGNARPYHALYQPQKWKEKEGITVNHTDGQLVFQSMVQHLDWVGTTECISTDTFQILQSIIPNYKNETNTFKAFNVGSKKKEIHQKGLTEDMLSLSQLDSVQKLMNVDVDFIITLQTTLDRVFLRSHHEYVEMTGNKKNLMKKNGGRRFSIEVYDQFLTNTITSLYKNHAYM
eukprot:CAMPEP_0170838184 /NCGR_PEP_ID=MMETSP0734-20130129/3246_1 /TAXON_ID=186038 /ORGANISM="Fragilariopsis kerguelensis, Strain L26-C5" /LENGTH=280 /DNA_ID=CAMNT_0011205583 /DNA_START=231 /DNA_END=1074 /DNA_ORIENTATION=+